MPPVADLIPTLHRVALFAFVGVTAVFMLVAVVNRLRLRRPLLVWRRSGAFTHVPLGPSLFLMLVAVGGGHVWLTGRPVPLAVLIGYPAGGIFWAVATWITRSVVITEYGIVRDINQGHRAVVWSQIIDYFRTTRKEQPHFAFFYRDADGERRRLDLSVPEKHASFFREIVERKLRTRFSISSEDTYDEETLGHLDDRIDLS